MSGVSCYDTFFGTVVPSYTYRGISVNLSTSKEKHGHSSLTELSVLVSQTFNGHTQLV